MCDLRDISDALCDLAKTSSQEVRRVSKLLRKVCSASDPWVLEEELCLRLLRRTRFGIGERRLQRARTERDILLRRSSNATLLNIARDGCTVEIGALQASPFTVPHDAREPLQLRCSDGNRHLGLVTDLGHASSHVVESLQGCHALLLEANHDPEMLQASSYPSFLKQRVAGPWGHLANHAAADLLARVKHAQLNYVLAAHLSERNNTPELARASLSNALGCTPLDIAIADPLTGSAWVTV